MKKGRKAVAICAVFIAAMMAIPAVYASIAGNTTITGVKHESISSGASTVSNNLGDLVVGTPDDEHEPSIEMDANGNLLVQYTKELSVFDSDVLLASSTDGGSSWSGVTPPWGEPMGGRQFATKLMYNPNVGVVIGGFADDATSSSIAFKTSDVTNPDAYLHSGYPNVEIIHDVSVTYFTAEDGTNVLNVQTVGDASGFPETCNWFYFALEDLSFFGQYYYYDAQSATGLYSEAGNIEGFAFADNHYGFVFDALREETGVHQPCIKWTVFEVEPDLEYVDNQFWLEDGDTEARDPDVAATGNSIYVVYGTFSSGDWGVVCKYSHDGGETWAESTVHDTIGGNPHPAVYASGNTVQVVYVNQGNLYLVKSEDGGATWGEPSQVNDQDGTVISEDGTCDISKAGIVWTDNRNGNMDIYFAAGEAAPILNVKSVSGGFGASAVIENTGTADATGVQWSIELSGLVFLGGRTEGTVDVPAGGEVTIKSGLVFGIGPGTIDVNAGGATKTASCLVLGPLVLGVK